VCGSTASAWYSKVSKSCSISWLLALGWVWMAGIGPGMGILDPCRSLRVISRSTSSGSAAWILSPDAVSNKIRASRNEIGRSPWLVTISRIGITPWLR
jgi:hypothetical protein